MTAERVRESIFDFVSAKGGDSARESVSDAVNSTVEKFSLLNTKGE
jgi:hypothetical protein